MEIGEPYSELLIYYNDGAANGRLSVALTARGG
jgi:hypothetical protein